MNRRGFFKLLAAAIATPLAKKILPQSFQQSVLDRINAETLRYIRFAPLADNFFVQSPLLAKLNAHARRESRGGDYLSSPIIYSDNKAGWDGHDASR